MLYLIAAAGSFLVGLSIGWCGIAGFLLPILFMGCCGFDSNAALFMSFLCFAVSGAIGARNYALRGELPMKQSLPLGISSLFGSAMGALIGQFFAGAQMKTVLYCVVLFSGCAVLLQEILLKRAEKRGAGAASAPPSPDTAPIPEKDIPESASISARTLPLIGVSTALLCSLSGAGGPVLVMPILVLLGMPVKAAIGAALFDSLFIALPAVLVYSRRADVKLLLPILAAALLSHALGIQLGSCTAGMIPQKPLKRAIALASIAFACFKLFW